MRTTDNGILLFSAPLPCTAIKGYRLQPQRTQGSFIQQRIRPYILDDAGNFFQSYESEFSVHTAKAGRIESAGCGAEDVYGESQFEYAD